MVKADLTRDYYGDLELEPTADFNEIKKQFKKLALTYHPDRNPGRETEVTAKFQKIQSAHEVLIDTAERAKYDANRVRPANRYQSGGNQRGNPWSNVSSQYPAPPKPPTARNRPPPPSAGAQRYKNFETPRQTPQQTAQEGAEARRSTYEAWENMRNSGTKPAPQKPWNKPSPVPQGTPNSSRDDNYSFKHRPPPKAAPDYDAFRSNYNPRTEYNSDSTPHRRAQSTSAQNRKGGFTPNIPGVDEPAGPRGAYSTSRKPTVAPEPPPRNPPSGFPKPPPNTPNVNIDPLNQFREAAGVPYEPRLSTPYTTHGGEKLDPFDSINMNRSKSTREPRDRVDSTRNIPRAGSDSHLNSPNRAQSSRQTNTTRPSTSYAVPPESESSSDSGPEIQGRRYAKARARSSKQQTNGMSPQPPMATPAQPSKMSDDTTGQIPRKPIISESGRWWHSDGQKENIPLNATSDRPSAGSGQANPHSNGEPSMYERPSFYSFSKYPYRTPSHEAKLPTVSETTPSTTPSYIPPEFSYPSMKSVHEKYSHLFSNTNDCGAKLATPPSGAPGSNLSPLEKTQRSVLEQLIYAKRRASDALSNGNDPDTSFDARSLRHPQPNTPGQTANVKDSFDTYREPTKACSSEHAKPDLPSVEQAQKPAPLQPHHLFGVNATRSFWDSMEQIKDANNRVQNRFNFKVDENTFQRTQSNGFSSSAENINTKFTPEEWEGKFEAGYFQPEQKAANMSTNPRGRAQSGSRSRGRSPIKVRPVDPHYQHTHSESEVPAESPNGTKFSQEQWAGTFKPQTFMPPPPPPSGPKMPPRPTRKSTRGSTARPTTGTAAIVIDSSDSEIEKPLFKGRARSNPTQAPPTPTYVPDAMDVDTPPTFTPATPTAGPRIVPQGLGINTSPGKRPAASSSTGSPIDASLDASLKVDFEDLKVQDIISSMNLPQPPLPPQVPTKSTTESRTPPELTNIYLEMMEKYMADWDLFTNRIMLHLVARKNQNDTMGSKRWDTDKGLETYRLGLREDKVVLSHLVKAQEDHAKVLKDHAIIRERMKERVSERPRKKVS